MTQPITSISKPLHYEWQMNAHTSGAQQYELIRRTGNRNYREGLVEINNDYAEFNGHIPHLFGQVHVIGQFRNGTLVNLIPVPNLFGERFKLFFGGKVALKKHLSNLLKKSPNIQVARALGVHRETGADSDEYHAGEIDDSKWKSESGLNGAHVYRDNFHLINTIHDGRALHVNGMLLWDERIHPVDFKLTPGGIEHGANSEEFLFPKKDNARAKYFRKTLRAALESHPYAHSVARGVKEISR